MRKYCTIRSGNDQVASINQLIDDNWRVNFISDVGNVIMEREVPDPPAPTPKTGLHDAAELVEHHGIQNL